MGWGDINNHIDINIHIDIHIIINMNIEYYNMIYYLLPYRDYIGLCIVPSWVQDRA